MTHRICNLIRRSARALLAPMALAIAAPTSASDHLDTPAVIADPRADIGDLYAWVSYEGRRLNLVMTLVGQTFSDKLEYVFHVDSGKRLGQVTATTSIVCRMPATHTVECRSGDVDVAKGDASGAAGLEGKNKRFRVFAGLRDDPFFNNVKGTRDAYRVAAAAIQSGAPLDAAGCPAFDAATSRAILDEWRHTDGGPGADFLKGWRTSALVVSVDLEVLRKGGPLLGVWATTEKDEEQIDRMGRPLTGNALLGLFAAADVSNALKEGYNRAAPATSQQFIPEIEKALAHYDSFDGQCGNQFLADRSVQSPSRYRALATLLVDDRLWVDTESTLCGELFSLERGDAMFCGGRTPADDAVDVYRSLLVTGRVDGVDDGVDRDDRQHSISEFPFLAAP